MLDQFLLPSAPSCTHTENFSIISTSQENGTSGNWIWSFGLLQEKLKLYAFPVEHQELFTRETYKVLFPSYIIRIVLLHHLVQGIQISFLVWVLSDSLWKPRYLNNGRLLGFQKWEARGGLSFRLHCCRFFSFDSSSPIIRTDTAFSSATFVIK